MSSVAQPERIERVYRLPTNLSIAYARMGEILPTGWLHDAGEPLHTARAIAVFDRRARGAFDHPFFIFDRFTLSPQELQERASADVRARAFYGASAGWLVELAKAEAGGLVETWSRQGLVARVGGRGELTLNGSPEEQQEQTREELRERLAAFGETRRLATEALLHGRLACELIAVTPTETLLVVRAKGYLARVADYVEEVAAWLWGVERETPNKQGLRAIGKPEYPTDPNDPRLLRAGLNRESRELIAHVNRGGEVSEFVRMRYGDSDASEANRLHQIVYRLRRKHPDLIAPKRKGLPRRSA